LHRQRPSSESYDLANPSSQRPSTSKLIKKVREFVERRGIGVWRVTHGPFTRVNFALYRIGHPPFGMSVRRRLITDLDVDLVIDCGANVGQYALGLRNAGYRGRIISVEPGAEPFESLLAEAAPDPNWHCIRAAIYDKKSRVTLNVSEESPCNTLLNPLGEASQTVPGITTVRSEEVDAVTLDSIASDCGGESERIWIKLDVEGAELKALAGARQVLGKTVAVEAELGLVPIYSEEPLFYDVSKALYDAGFFLCNASGAYQDQAGTWIKIDGIFIRNEFRGKVRL
jgi:FkbM family methyltransferase